MISSFLFLFDSSPLFPWVLLLPDLLHWCFLSIMVAGSTTISSGMSLSRCSPGGLDLPTTPAAAP